MLAGVAPKVNTQMVTSSPLSTVTPRASLDAMLTFAWATGPFTAGDAVDATGLTRSTAIDAIDALIDIGLLHELPNARAAGQYRKGRPSRRFELDASAASVIGIDAGAARLNATLADLRGIPLVRRIVDLPSEDAAVRRAAIVETVERLREQSAGSPLLAICVGVPAPVDGDGVSPPHRNDFWRRMNPDLRSALAPFAPVVRVENDATLAAVAEGAQGAAVGCTDFITLLSGDRFGSGVVLGGRVLRGAHGGVGEMNALAHVVDIGVADGLGRRLQKWARERVQQGDVPHGHPLAGSDPDAITGRTVFELAEAGDPWADDLIRRGGALLARVVGMLASLFDPARVVISGASAGASERLIAVARDLVSHEVDVPAPEIVASQLGGEVVAVGAVAAALEAARESVLYLPR